MDSYIKLDNLQKHIDIVGAGPSGLFAAYLLLKKGYQINLYDHSSGPGKKFLVAGNGGLNLTHSNPPEVFSEKYTEHATLFSSLLDEFSPQGLRSFCSELGVETFIGSSGRVFPKELNAAKMLRNWITLLRDFEGFNLILNHRLIKIQTKNDALAIHFQDLKNQRNIEIRSQSTILALGGGSWKKTGSDGTWVSMIRSLGIEVAEFKAYNCGYNVDWSEIFQKKVDYSYLKNIAIDGVKGEVMITPYGIEGSLIYANSKSIQKDLSNKGIAAVNIDLRPLTKSEELLNKLKKVRAKDSRKNQLRKCLRIKDTEYMLLMELLSKEELNDDIILVEKIKNLTINLKSARPIDEAISTRGGVEISELTDHFESKKIKGLYFSGEMLNWDAPTGGYLLQGCFCLSRKVSENF